MPEVKTIKAVIVDDESLARTRIRRLLEKSGDITVVAECTNGLEVVEFFRTGEADLLFLDIQMPELDGFEVLDNFPTEKLPVVIFVTAYDKYALKAFDVHAIDYLLKPFEDERFYEALNYARELLLKQNQNSLSGKLKDLLIDYLGKESTRDSDFYSKITIKTAGKYYLINTDEIIRIKAAGKYLEIKTKDEKYLTRKTIKEIGLTLNPAKFLRIHRSTIINIDFIKELQHWYKSDYIIVLANGEKFTSSKTYKLNVEKVLNQFK